MAQPLLTVLNQATKVSSDAFWKNLQASVTPGTTLQGDLKAKQKTEAH
jgi:hypothetical protein